MLLRPQRDTAIPDLAVAVEERAPVASLGGFGEVSLSEGPDVVLGDSFRRVGVGDKRLDLVGEVGEIAFNFDVVLGRAAGGKEVVMVLDVLETVGDDD